MKKTAAWVLIVCLILVLSACNSGDKMVDKSMTDKSMTDKTMTDKKMEVKK
jgi:uncharacterized lipoprotein